MNYQTCEPLFVAAVVLLQLQAGLSFGPLVVVLIKQVLHTLVTVILPHVNREPPEIVHIHVENSHIHTLQVQQGMDPRPLMRLRGKRLKQ